MAAARRLVQGLAAATGASAFALYVDAPAADAGDGSYARARPQTFPEWLHDVARAPVFASATLVAKVYLSALNRTTVDGADALVAALDRRPRGTALITVSNHSATVDDPGVIAKYVDGCGRLWALRTTLTDRSAMQHGSLEVCAAAQRPLEPVQVRPVRLRTLWPPADGVRTSGRLTCGRVWTPRPQPRVLLHQGPPAVGALLRRQDAPHQARRGHRPPRGCSQQLELFWTRP